MGASEPTPKEKVPAATPRAECICTVPGYMPEVDCRYPHTEALGMPIAIEVLKRRTPR